MTLDGSPIDRDVSAAQIAFWNEGRAAIRPDNILSALRISTVTQAPILEVSVRKKTRDVLQIFIDDTEFPKGAFVIRWNILEHNDGAVVQVVFLGQVETPITATATVEGQGEIDNPRYEISRPPMVDSSKRFYRSRALGWAFLVVSIILGGAVIVWRREEREEAALEVREVAYTFQLVSEFAIPGTLFIAAMYLLFFAERPGPPFGF